MTPTGTARFRLWEHIFFSGTAGALLIYPFIRSSVAPVFSDAWAVFILAISALAFFVTAALYAEAQARGNGRWILFSAISAGAAILLSGDAAFLTSPLFTAWVIDLSLAIFSFGYLLTKRLFRRAERDFMQHVAELMAIAFLANVTLILAITVAANLPPLFIACATLAIFLVTLLP